MLARHEDRPVRRPDVLLRDEPAAKMLAQDLPDGGAPRVRRHDEQQAEIGDMIATRVPRQAGQWGAARIRRTHRMGGVPCEMTDSRWAR